MKTKNLIIRVDDDLKMRIEEAAKKENRTLSNYVLTAVLEKMEKN